MTLTAALQADLFNECTDKEPNPYQKAQGPEGHMHDMHNRLYPGRFMPQGTPWHIAFGQPPPGDPPKDFEDWYERSTWDHPNHTQYFWCSWCHTPTALTYQYDRGYHGYGYNGYCVKCGRCWRND